jgi:hypothetical protein
MKDILLLKIKPKEKVNKILQLILDEPNSVQQLIDNFKEGSKVEKGTYAEVLKHVSKKDPTIIEPYIDELTGYVNYEANRVKWGIPETIGNLAEKYPKKVEKSVPSLLINANDKSTVVRWCAAYALSKIALHNLSIRNELVKKFEEILSIEKNNGVKKVYLGTLKEIEKVD